MRTVHCPLCGLRFARPGELDEHARDDHAPPLPAEVKDALKVTHPHYVELPIDQVLRRRTA